MNPKAIGRAFARGALRTLILIVRVLPLPIGLSIGRGIGNVLRPFFHRRYKVAQENLDLAYGDSLTPAEKTRIARESFKNWGMFAVESSTVPPRGGRNSTHPSHRPSSIFVPHARARYTTPSAASVHVNSKITESINRTSFPGKAAGTPRESQLQEIHPDFS